MRLKQIVSRHEMQYQDLKGDYSGVKLYKAGLHREADPVSELCFPGQNRVI